jgi:lactoylglutathione lyase
VPATANANIKEAVPFLVVSDMTKSFAYYTEGLGFQAVNQWERDGKLRWCCLRRGGAALMLQQMRTEGPDAWEPRGPVGEGIAIHFICEDAVALYREIATRGIAAGEPVVANRMCTTSLSDPDGYRICFASPSRAGREVQRVI